MKAPRWLRPPPDCDQEALEAARRAASAARAARLEAEAQAPGIRLEAAESIAAGVANHFAASLALGMRMRIGGS